MAMEPPKGKPRVDHHNLPLRKRAFERSQITESYTESMNSLLQLC